MKAPRELGLFVLCSDAQNMILCVKCQKKIDFFCQFCGDSFGNKKNSNIIQKFFNPIARSGMN